jgi:hypothetical protein
MLELRLSLQEKGRGEGREKFPGLHASRRAILKLEIIHQAGGVGAGWLESVWQNWRIESKIKSNVNYAPLKKASGRYKVKSNSTSKGKRAGGTPALPNATATAPS